MAIIKNELPILEYDSAQTAVIMPGDDAPLRLPEKCVFAFLGPWADNYATAAGAETVFLYKTITKEYPVYITKFRNEDVVLCQAPLGASAAVQILDWLIAHGVKKIIAAGSCGVLVNMPENAFLVPVRALRDEGASYHYLPPSRFVELGVSAVASLEKTLTRLGLPFAECTTWTTDGFYRETADMVSYRKEEGCTVVDMECAALTACAQFRGAQYAQLLYTADSLAETDAYDARGWGEDSMERALHIALEAVCDM